MARLVWCLLFSVFLFDGIILVPAASLKTNSGLFDLKIFSEKQRLIGTHLKEFSVWTRNSLNLIQTVARAVEDVISEEFVGQVKQFPNFLGTNLLRGLQNFCVELQQYIDIIKIVLPSPPAHQSKEFPEVYIYKRVLGTLKTSISTLRSVASQILASYNYYTSEITLTRCIGKYLNYAHPELFSRSLLAYPIRFIRYAEEWFLEFGRGSLGLEHRNTNYTKASENDTPLRLNFPIEDWTRQQNGVENNDIPKVFSRKYRDLTTELSPLEQYLSTLFDFDDVIAEHFGLTEDERTGRKIITPTKCFQIYAVEILWDRLEKYLSH